MATKRSTSWCDGSVSGPQTTPVSLARWLSARAFLSAVGNFFITPSEPCSDFCFNSAKASVWLSQKRRLSDAIGPGANATPPLIWAAKSVNGVSSCCPGLYATEKANLPNVFKPWWRRASRMSCDTPNSSARRSNSAVESSSAVDMALS